MAKGHEIGAYCTDAAGATLPSLTIEQADTALRAIRDAVITNFGVVPRSCSYRQGTGVAREHQIASRYFDHVRKTGGKYIPNGNFFAVIAMLLNNPANDVTIHEKVIEALQYCAKTGAKLVLYAHECNDSGQLGSMTADNFEKVVKAAYDLGVPILPLNKLLAPYNLISDPWWESSIIEDGHYGNGWRSQYSAGLTPMIEIVSGGGAWGGNCLKVTGCDASSYISFLNLVQLIPGVSTYYLRVPYKISGITSVKLLWKVNFYDAVDTALTATTETNATTNTDWTTSSGGHLDITVPAGAVYADVFIQLYHINAEAEIRLDRVIFTPQYAGDFGVTPV